jgi:hypothetical protein
MIRLDDIMEGDCGFVRFPSSAFHKWPCKKLQTRAIAALPVGANERWPHEVHVLDHLAVKIYS